jgi:hypothetical protein
MTTRKPSGFIAKQNQKGCASTKNVGAINMRLEQNEARVKNGLAPVVSKKRRCLRCDTTFLSTNEQRCCDGCRITNARQSYFS